MRLQEKSEQFLLTAHTHSYCRTKLMKNFEKFEYSNDSDDSRLVIKPSQTIAACIGIGGKNVSSCSKANAKFPWFASALCKGNSLLSGSLFCKLNYNGIADFAYCYLKQIDGQIRDEFYLDFKKDKKQKRFGSSFIQ